MLRTKFTELIGCKVPIQMAAIGGLAKPPLAAAVSNAGGLGMLQLSGFTPAQATRALEEVRKRTSGVFGANFILAGHGTPISERFGKSSRRLPSLREWSRFSIGSQIHHSS